MNMFKKNGGFTLVELIVVIAILAILAAVAIPAYSGYITKAQEANDYTALDSVKTAVVFAAMDLNPNAVVKTITVTEGSPIVAITGDNLTVNGTAFSTVDITAYVGAAGIDFKSDNNTATVNLTVAEPKWDLDKK